MSTLITILNYYDSQLTDRFEEVAFFTIPDKDTYYRIRNKYKCRYNGWRLLLDDII